MIIGVPRETSPGETRVALVPAVLPMLTREGFEVRIEAGAGLGASISDREFTKAGARIAKSASALFRDADVLIKVQPPAKQRRGGHEAEWMKNGATYIGSLSPFAAADVLRIFAKKKVTSFSMEFVPRITRAQGMDALSSMATIAGYKAVLVASEHLGKVFPLMMTAAGTIPPATVLVLGAGVAGLQAIATAKRLGAKVEAFDPRPAVKEQVKSLGAAFIEMEMPKDAETAGGYAKELSPEFIRKEHEAIEARLPRVNVVITTAQVFGKRAPLLITRSMMKKLHPGSVIVDLAADQGGNCEGTKAGQAIQVDGVTLIGTVNLARTVPMDASQMYSRNVMNLFKLLYPKPDATPDFNDEIIKGACLTRAGEIVNDHAKAALQKKGKKR